MSYYIGVDGGGTKTAYALFDEYKNVLGMVKTTGTNHENLAGSYNEACEILMQGITRLLIENNIKLADVSGILMGLAGIDHDFQHDAMCAILSSMGLKRFRIYNDGYLAVKACAPGVGIAYNCGTGTCCNSIDDNGSMLQVGGFSTLSGDVGNGHWISHAVFSCIYSEIILKAKKTAMTEMFFERYEGANAENLLSVIPVFEDENNCDTLYRVLTDIFFDALNMGDSEAQSINAVMADTGSDFICAHLKRQTFVFDPVNVILTGSMHTKLPNEIYVEELKRLCAEKSGRELNFVKLTAQPVMGCINWLLEGDKKI